MSDSQRRHSTVRRGYLIGLVTSASLFIFHTFVIFYTSFFLTKDLHELMKVFGPHVVGPTVILIAFVLLFTAHFLEAAAWAVLFQRVGQFESFGESLYFAGTSLTALGYGDVVLRYPYRVLGPIMATNGLLMFGCSTAFLFLLIQKVWEGF